MKWSPTGSVIGRKRHYIKALKDGCSGRLLMKWNLRNEGRDSEVETRNYRSKQSYEPMVQDKGGRTVYRIAFN